MKEQDFCKLSDVLGAALKKYNFDETITQGQVERAYKELVGPFLAKLTYSIHYDNERHTLFLKISSPAMRQEFSYKIEELRRSINERLPQPIIHHIVLG